MVNYHLESYPGLTKSFHAVIYIRNDISLVDDKESSNDFKPNYVLTPGLDGVDIIRIL